MPISGKEMRKLFKKAGFVVVSGAGKGSHWKLRKGNCTVIVPDHRELSIGVEHSLKKILNKKGQVGENEIHFNIHKDEKYYWAECLELEGCITQGASLEELRVNMSEALNLYLNDAPNGNNLVPMPYKKMKADQSIEEVAVLPEIAFPILMKYHRVKKHKMTQSEVAKQLGMPNVYSYQRLEEKKCNPTLKILSKISRTFPGFSVDYALSSR